MNFQKMTMILCVGQRIILLLPKVDKGKPPVNVCGLYDN